MFLRLASQAKEVNELAPEQKEAVEVAELNASQRRMCVQCAVRPCAERVTLYTKKGTAVMNACVCGVLCRCISNL